MDREPNRSFQSNWPEQAMKLFQSQIADSVDIRDVQFVFKIFIQSQGDIPDSRLH